MKKLKSTLTLIVLITSTFACSPSKDWQLFETNDFQALYPNIPSTQVQTVNTAMGELKMNVYMYDASNDGKDENLVYGVLSTEYPDSLINSERNQDLSGFFRSSIDGAVNNVKGKLISESIIEFNEYPGREFKVDYKDGLAIIKMRIILVKNKMFFLQTITITKNDNNKSIDKFMNSFKLK